MFENLPCIFVYEERIRGINVYERPATKRFEDFSHEIKPQQEIFWLRLEKKFTYPPNVV